MTKMMKVTGIVGGITAKEEERLAAAGFAPVVRWVRVRGRSEKALRTREALTLIDREEARAARKSA